MTCTHVHTRYSFSYRISPQEIREQVLVTPVVTDILWVSQALSVYINKVPFWLRLGTSDRTPILLIPILMPAAPGKARCQHSYSPLLGRPAEAP